MTHAAMYVNFKTITQGRDEAQRVRFSPQKLEGPKLIPRSHGKTKENKHLLIQGSDSLGAASFLHSCFNPKLCESGR